MRRWEAVLPLLLADPEPGFDTTETLKFSMHHALLATNTMKM